MSSFFSAYQQATGNTNNPHAEATPLDIEVIRSILGSSLRIRSDEVSHLDMDPEMRAQFQRRLMDMMDQLNETSSKMEGAPQSFIDGLERVPKKYLKKGMTCPICAVDFVDDEYPLVVELPCHPDHLFDLECITPWLLTKSTCPLDRKELLKKKEVPKPVEDDEEDYDEYYA